MAAMHFQPTDDAIKASPTAAQTAADLCLARRASLRSYTRSLLRELSEQHDHAIGVDARAAIAQRVRDLEVELVAALRGDVAAIDALCVKSRAPAR